MMRAMKSAMLAGAAVALLGGCAAGTGPAPTASGTQAWDAAIQQQVDQQLAQSAARAANALETLAMIQRVRTEPVAAPIDETGLPAELARRTTVEWSGPAKELVKELAANIGYDFTETGGTAAAPAMVHVNVRDVSAAKALEDIGLQVQQWATVIVDPNLKRVEYRNESWNSNAAQTFSSSPKPPSLKGGKPGRGRDFTK